MPEAVSVDRSAVTKAATTVSASALAVHLDCTRTYIGKLEAEGVIQRQGDRFPLDQSRVPLPAAGILLGRKQWRLPTTAVRSAPTTNSG